MEFFGVTKCPKNKQKRTQNKKLIIKMQKNCLYLAVDINENLIPE